MRVLYLDCFSGISGDMTLGALISLGADTQYLKAELSKLGIDDEYCLTCKEINSYGITGVSVDVILKDVQKDHDHRHHHDAVHMQNPAHDDECLNQDSDEKECHGRDLWCNSDIHSGHIHHEENHLVEKNKTENEPSHAHTHAHEHIHYKSIKKLINDCKISENARKLSLDIFEKIATAEAEVHGKNVEDVCFHEVGAVDSIIDIVGTAILLDSLKIEKIVHSSINVGGGTVKCAHGILPVPAPATAKLLKGKIVFGQNNIGELTTPTGAGILSLGEHGEIPKGKVLLEGFGFGKKDIGSPNCLRAMIIATDEKDTDRIAELSANIDDMTAEELSYAMEKLFEAGALDAWATSILMKKGRPAIMLSAMANVSNIQTVIEAFFKYTTSLGVRYVLKDRAVQSREIQVIKTPYGNIRIKKSGENLHAEYEDYKTAANRYNMSIREIARCAIAAYESER